jgi:hypothetical protein
MKTFIEDLDEDAYEDLGWGRRSSSMPQLMNQI